MTTRRVRWGLWLGLLLGGVVLAAGPHRAAAAPAVGVPERARVCMMQDTVMAAPAIPLTHAGRTYFGCCEMCKARIAADPDRFTRATDPVSGATVDKATAELLSVDGRVVYFESAATRAAFARRLTGSK